LEADSFAAFRRDGQLFFLVENRCNKKPRSNKAFAENSPVAACAATFMGEEKPDEELMGKRKSSPRLSSTSLDADSLRIASFSRFIHRSHEIL
jgi:hypothetical protein